MTPEPMSDEQFKNARLAVQEAWNHWNTHEYIRDRLYDLLHECERLRALQPAIPPDVKAAMERYKRHMPDSEGPSPYWLASKKAWDNQRLTADVWTITNWAVSHFGLFPVVDGQGVGE